MGEKCRLIDLTGKRFERLVVVRLAGTDRRGEALWECKCDCGKTSCVLGSHLRAKRIRSCGCLQKELSAIRIEKNRGKGNTKHGGTQTRLYQIWANMKTRCLNQNNRAYKWYGALGVTICSDWLNFENFYQWAKDNGYQENLTIERKNPFGNYEPSNCTWIPKSEQRKNQRRSKEWQNKN